MRPSFDSKGTTQGETEGQRKILRQPWQLQQEPVAAAVRTAAGVAAAEAVAVAAAVAPLHCTVGAAGVAVRWVLAPFWRKRVS